MNDSVWYTHKDQEWSGLALTYLIVTSLDHLNSLDLGKSWFSVLCIPWWISIRWGEAYTPNLDSWVPIKYYSWWKIIESSWLLNDDVMLWKWNGDICDAGTLPISLQCPQKFSPPPHSVSLGPHVGPFSILVWDCLWWTIVTSHNNFRILLSSNDTFGIVG